MGLMEQFSDPNLMDQLSMAEKLGGAGITTLMGMGVTFVILLLLWLFLAVMAKIVSPKKKEEVPAAAAATPSEAAAPAAAVEDDKALIAVITAAIAAAEGRAASQLVVRKINRISGETTAWGLAGRTDCIESRKF